MTQGYNRELGRPFRRTVYSINDWKQHRQEDRHLKHLGTLTKSEVLSGLLPPTFLCAASASLVCAFETAREVYPTTAGLLPSLLVDSLPFELTSSALGLLLVFRTEASYARWLDARKLLSSVQASSACAARSAVVWFNNEDQDLSAAFVRWSKAFFKTLQHHVRGCEDDEDLERDLSEYLWPSEVKSCSKAHNRPQFVLQMLSAIANNAQLNSDQHVSIDSSLARVGDMLTECERIVTTPVPLSYTRFTNRFLLVWLLFLPTCLYESCGLWSIPSTMLVSVVLLGIEEVGVQIEEPFSILPLEVMSEFAVESLCQLEQNQSLVSSLTPMIREYPNEKSGQVPGKGRNPINPNRKVWTDPGIIATPADNPGNGNLW
eukprot:CAMPEP_0198229422 /NCGR_PEP_ID=MMETSP1445-20131203/114118_1 /TAXON_ID=36898 /ORGANISM="Pyramimonas sp., Strain CCMP2087" /LENGTH=374 /DNA_ID=CAMNT_0043909885 /DNA_START=881 /DNA_END=2005 /DNA_ORIENTATION=+